MSTTDTRRLLSSWRNSSDKITAAKNGGQPIDMLADSGGRATLGVECERQRAEFIRLRGVINTDLGHFMRNEAPQSNCAGQGDRHVVS